MGPAPGQIASLDGVRAAAVMVVFLAHAGLDEWIPGNFGVTVFFFLSGYLITTLLRLELARTGTIDLRAFYLRRSLRILPPMFVVLSAASALTVLGVLEGAVWPQAFAAQSLHLTNYYVIANGWWNGMAPGSWIYWSLAVEEHFYILFPLAFIVLARYVRSHGRQALVLLAVCGLVLAWRLVLVLVLDAPKDRTYIATDTRIDSILFGCALALGLNPVLDRVRLSERVWVMLLFPAGLIAIVASYAIRAHEFQETLRYTVQGIALVPLFVVAIRQHGRSIFRVLNWRPVAFFGVLSYSFYLVHPTVIFGVWQWTDWPRLTQGILAFALSLLLSSAIYVAIERPSARLRRRLSRASVPVVRDPEPRLEPQIGAPPPDAALAPTR